MSAVLAIDDYDLDGFSAVAADFGIERYGYVVTPNVDHLLRYHDDAQFRLLYEQAAYVLLDSRVLARLLRLTRAVRLRVCPGSDLTLHVLSKLATAQDTVVLVGGRPAQADELRRRFGLQALRHIEAPMGFIQDPAAVERCLRQIEDASPFRFCLLAIGSPRQELLAQRLLARGRARGLALCIGASVNFVTGEERRAPRWIQRLGLEWLFRLLQNPSRLAGRYLVRGPRIFRLLPRIGLQVRRPRPPPQSSHTASG